MNERIETQETLKLPPQLTADFDEVVALYVELVGGEPEVIRELVLANAIEQGLGMMREAYSRRALVAVESSAVAR